MNEKKGSGAPKITQVAISNVTPTPIYTGRDLKVGVQIKNVVGNATIYLGGSDVSTSNGYPLAASETVFIPADEIILYRALATNNNERLALIPI
jgi:hypothetical protein